MEARAVERPDPLAVTRVGNACVLIEIGGAAVLTDPWFRKHWAFTEGNAIAPWQLPRLSAIVGSHSVFDHWNIDALAAYPFKASTPVLVATALMERKARRAGFTLVERVEWGITRRTADGLSIDVVEAQKTTALRVNNYVLTMGAGRVFFGGETLAREPLRRYGRAHPPVDVFIGPCNGIRLLGHQLVADAAEAVEAAQAVGARTIIPIHYAQRRLWPLAAPRASGLDVETAAAGTGIRVVCLTPGVRWVWDPCAGVGSDAGPSGAIEG